jgi:hypothetical protein
MAKKEIFDQANRIAFVGGKVVAFDDAVAIFHPQPGGLEFEGSVDGARLVELLSRIKTETIKVTVEDTRLRIKAGRSDVKFDVLPVQLPIDSVDMTGDAVDLVVTDKGGVPFVDQLRWVSPSCARDTSRPALTCVMIEGGIMQATDSFRASRVQCADEALPRLMLPLSQVQVLVKDDYKIRRVALSEGGEWARFECEDDVTLCCRSMSGKFPSIDEVFVVQGKEIKLTGTIDDAMDRAHVFSKRENAADEEVKLTMRRNQVVVSAHCDGGSFEEIVQCEGAVEGIEFTIHPKLLAAALRSNTSCVVGTNRVLFSGKDWQHIVALKGG